MVKNKLHHSFFREDALTVAESLLGKNIVRKYDDGIIQRYTIIETEAYVGEEDLACHASKGKTKRTEVMYQKGGKIYVYLIYGMYWMLNFVTGNEDNPEAILIRGVIDCSGPGRLGKLLKLDKSFYGENLDTSNRLWVEDSDLKIKKIVKTPRIGIDYSGEIWKNKPWRFLIENN